MAISTVFTNNRTQAVRLPAEMRLPDDIKRWRYERVAKTGSSPPWAIVGMNFF